jgi:thymidylate synthase
MNKLDKQYTDLLATILEHGVTKQDRTGTGTRSIFGYTIRHNMKDGFPLLTTKKMPFKTIVTELLWFLRGDTNIKFLVDNNCHIWDGDAYKNYCMSYKDGHEFYEDETVKRSYTQEEFINKIKTDDEFANKWGELGPIYGKQWRRWDLFGYEWELSQIVKKGKVDQIQNLINDLKTNPDSRRLMVNAWNVGELDQMVLPPCHYGFQVYTRELKIQERMDWLNKKNNTDERYRTSTLDELNVPTRAISLMWNQRSVDTFLGLPFNIASYGLLLEIIAKEVNMVPDELIGNLGDVHLYSNHIEQAKEQIGRKYTHEERTELLKQAMGEERYDKAVDELMPFGGGLSEYYDSYKIPKRTKEPFLLPTLNFSNWYKNANDEKQSEIVFNEWIESIKIGDFKVENYQSHSAISAPLSN